MPSPRPASPPCPTLRSFTACAAVALACCAAMPAQAGRPLATEDAGVLEAGDCELELYGAHQRLRPAGRERGVSLQGSCGAGHGVQAALALQTTRERGTDQAGRSDGGLLGFKARLLGNADADASLTLVGAAAWSRDGHRAFRRDSLAIGLAGSAALADGLTGHANLGHLGSQADHQRSTLWALAVEWAAAGSVDLGAELYGDDHRRPWAGLGLRWVATPTLTLGTSYALQTASGRARLFTLGLTAGF